jgi:hypothetical protein
MKVDGNIDKNANEKKKSMDDNVYIHTTAQQTVAGE